MIKQRTITEIFETVKIEEVVGDYVQLKRRGQNMLGLCPFHNEKTPSFTVSPAKNIYKCFGCGEGGNSVNFIMNLEGLTYPEALRNLAQKYNIAIEESVTTDEQKKERQLYDSLYLANDFAKDYFQKQLFETERGRNVALAYFKERGFREDIIKKFGLGYAPAKGDAFTLHAVNAGYKVEMLQKAGLTSRHGRDFFRDRVQFTIFNISGKVVGFGGRILVKNKKAPKYVNTPDSEIYNKSKVLYGANFARKSIRQLDECIMVEGYTDVISLHQSGVENVVASSGTSLTIDQIKLVKRYTPNMKILYDGDPAGVKAALRGLDLVLEQDMNVRIVLLPTGEDPDSYMQKVGVTAFKEYLEENASDFILFKTNLLLEDAKGDPIKMANLIKDIVETISKIPDEIKRSVYIRECANRLNVSEAILLNSTNKAMVAEAQKAERQAYRDRERSMGAPPSFDDAPPPPPPDFEGYESSAPPPWEEKKQWKERKPWKGGKPEKEVKKPVYTPSNGDEFQEKEIVRLLMAFGEEIMEEGITVGHYVLSNIEEFIEEFDHKFYKAVVNECLERLQAHLSLDQPYFLQHPEPDVSELAATLLTVRHEYSKNWAEKLMNPLQTQPMPEKNFKRDTEHTVNIFKFRKISKMLETNKVKIKELQEQGGDAMLMIKQIKVQQKLLNMREELAKLIRADGAVK